MKSMAKKTGVAITAMVLVAATVSYGLPIIEIQDGDSNAFSGWGATEERIGGGAAEGTHVTPDPQTVDGETAVHITADTSGDFIPREDIVFTTGSSLAGNLDFTDAGLDVTTIEFDFYAGADGMGSGGAPDSLSLYLQAGGAAVWYYEIDLASIQDGWSHYVVNFRYGTGWTGWDSNAELTSRDGTDWATDMADVDELGFAIQYATDLDGQNYAFDDVGLHSPEPETYMVLGVALLSLAIVFRKKIKESLMQARSVVNA
ncbi:hypothetical protein H8D64_00565 [PVC group bacterium]|nr:hypothetical protein [PVC group bacterium]